MTTALLIIVFLLLLTLTVCICTMLIYTHNRMDGVSRIINNNAKISNQNEATQKDAYNDLVKTVNKNFDDIDTAVALISERMQKLEKYIEEATQYTQTHKVKL